MKTASENVTAAIEGSVNTASSGSAYACRGNTADYDHGQNANNNGTCKCFKHMHCIPFHQDFYTIPES